MKTVFFDLKGLWKKEQESVLVAVAVISLTDLLL